MDNYIFLTNYYLPKPGATGMCVHQIAKELIKQNNNVLVIGYEDDDNKNVYENVNTQKIKMPFYLKNINKKNTILNRIKHIVQLIVKAYYLKKYPLRSKKLVQNYKKCIIEYIKANKIKSCTLVATYTPLETVLAASELKEEYPNIFKIVYYSADTLSNEQGEDGILSSSVRERLGKKWEIKLFAVYDLIFLMECHKKYYSQDVYIKFKNKIKYANFPLLTENNLDFNSTIIKEKSKIYFTYAGTFYRIIRNPEYLCNILVNLTKKIDMEVNLLGGGDCDDILKKAESESNNKIIYKGMCSHKDAIKYINMADILLSIGNKNCPMAPSKIYEYMSTGKPIIHIYSDKNDTCLEPLKKYKNALLIKERELKAEEKITEFISEYKILNYEEIEKMFLTSTPQYTANILKNMNRNYKSNQE